MAEGFEREQNVHEAEARDRPAEIGIFQKQTERGVLVQIVVGIPDR